MTNSLELGVHDAHEPGITIGEFTAFTHEIEAAVVSGPDIDHAIAILGELTPFRSKEEANTMTFTEAMDASRAALSTSGIVKLAVEVGTMEPETTRLIVSRSGALALRSAREGGDENKALLKAKRQITWLNEGEFCQGIRTKPASVLVYHTLEGSPHIRALS